MFELEVTSETRISTIGELIDKFHDDLEGCSKRPIGFVCNPENKQGDLWFPYDDVWVAVYRRNYMITITKNNHRLNGPHTVKLNCRISTDVKTGNIWLATAQIKGKFFDEKTIYRRLIKIVANREFFATDKSRAQLAEFTPDEEKPEAPEAFV